MTNMADHIVRIDPDTGYFRNIDDIRQLEYPQLKGTDILLSTSLHAEL